MRRRTTRKSLSAVADPRADAKEDSAEAAIWNAMAIQPDGIAFGCSRCCDLETERT
jgi:hypothetical protein